MTHYHIPVMTKEAIEYLSPTKNGNYIDCTLGLGGHTEEILKLNGPNGKVLAIDQDPEGIHDAEKKLEKYKNRIIYITDNFRNLDKIVRNSNFQRISGILFDLGLASWQISDEKKGLSFTSEFLDMRLSPDKKYTARDILNTYSEKQLSNLFYTYGDIRKNRSLAKRIMISRKTQSIETPADLIKVIGTNNPKVLAPIFQALRIEVNDELESLSLALSNAIDVLDIGGRIVVISYHSGEDRIAKNFFRSNKSKLKILTKKPDTPTLSEIRDNPRSRSAKLRAAEKIG